MKNSRPVYIGVYIEKLLRRNFTRLSMLKNVVAIMCRFISITIEKRQINYILSINVYFLIFNFASF